jgi:Tol biopolymer transport system component
MEVTGEAVPVGEVIGDTGRFSASQNGILAYRTGSNSPNTQLRWFDRTGKPLGVIGEPGRNPTMALSPDGTRVAISRGLRGIWMYELENGTSQSLTFGPANDLMPVWSPDSSRLAFASIRTGIFDIYQKASSGVGNEDLLLKSSEAKFPYDWSPDGRWLIYGLRAGQYDLWVLPLMEHERRPVRYLVSQFNK